MTAKQTMRLVALLNKAADYADKYDAQLPNGGYVGSLVGSMANDLKGALRDKDNAGSGL